MPGGARLTPAPEGAWTRHPFLLRLGKLAGLGEGELAALAALLEKERAFGARSVIVHEGDKVGRIHVLSEGWACRYKHLADGRRQITAVLVPGDVMDLDSLRFGRAGETVATITPCAVAALGSAAVRELGLSHPRIGEAMAWLGAVENAALAERNVCLGRRSAREHLAHLLCELQARLAAIGEADESGFALPLTQEQIADIMGLSSIHVSRTFMDLRSEGLIELQRRRLEIRNLRELRRVAGFRPDYLHLEGMRGGEDASGEARAARA